MDDKFNRYVKSSKINDEILCKGVISELSATRQEKESFRQDVSMKNQEVQKWNISTKNWARNRKENCRDYEEVIELKRQNAGIKDNKSNQLRNYLCARKIQVQPEPTIINVTSYIQIQSVPGNVPDFGRMFLTLKYTDITANTYIRSWTVTEIMMREVWKYDSCYTLIDYQIHIKTDRNM